MSLRDDLAKRLMVVLEPHGDSLLDRDDWIYSLTDECIRQMEWARSSTPPLVAGLLQCECGQMHIAGSDLFDMVGHGYTNVVPLSLAPDGWNAPRDR